MSSLEKELEEQLTEAGNRLLKPPSSVDELLSLLEQVESFLSRVEQSPSKSMLTALNPSMNALAADELVSHSDVDVKVAVASCISEITRITAPDAPYDDDKMKDVFQLIVSSFENLSDKSSQSYNRRAMILETVAKVRSCVVMLDLECDGLIIEMFQHFLKAIRDCHPENVFSSMETIMTLVLEESEDISVELLSPILDSLKMDNEPISRKLGEKVFENCAVKLKPYLSHVVKSLGIALNDYSEVVASICEVQSGGVEHNDDNALGEPLGDESKMAMTSSEQGTQLEESKLVASSSDDVLQVSREGAGEEGCPEGFDPAFDRSPKVVMSNGATKTGADRNLVDPEFLKKTEKDDPTTQSTVTNETVKAVADGSDARTSVKSEPKLEQSAKRRGRKPKSVINSNEPCDSTHVESQKEVEKLLDHQDSCSKDTHSSPVEDPSMEMSAPAESEKEDSLRKASESEAVNISSPHPSSSVPDESQSKKAGWPKRENKVHEDTPHSDVSKKPSEGEFDSEVKAEGQFEEKAPGGINGEEKIQDAGDISKNEDGTTSDAEAKQPKQSDENVDGNSKDENRTPLKKEDGKRRGRGKAILEKDVTKSTKDEAIESVSSPKSSIKSVKDEGHLEEISKINSKRKRTPDQDEEPQGIEYGEKLVGSKVKVWWPKDRVFYEGVIKSFDRVKKKHEVLYTDGDIEILNLKKERWEFVKDNSSPDWEEEIQHRSLDASSEMPKKKRAKTNSESSSKHGKVEVSPKRGGAASSSKSKGTASKFGNKLSNDVKVDGKSKVRTSDSGGRSEDAILGKLKGQSQKGRGKSHDVPKMVGKSKDGDGGTPTSAKSKQEALKNPTKSKQGSPKTTAKPKQDTPQTVTKSKGKSPLGGSKSNANYKVKTSSSKVKGTIEMKEKSLESTRTLEASKGKATDAVKTHESEAKSGKKRRRAVKS